MYLKELRKNYKKLYFFVLLFIVGQVFFTYKGVETFPFFNYGMYSGEESNPSIISYYLIYNDTILLNDAFRTQLHKDMVMNTLKGFDQINTKDSLVQIAIDGRMKDAKMNTLFKNRLLNSSLSRDSFKPWLRHYLSETLNTDIQHLKVIKLSIHKINGFQKQQTTLIDFK